MAKKAPAAKALEVANAHLAAGRLAQARAACEGVLAKAPNNAQAMEILGIVHLQQGRKTEAADLFRRVARLRPRSATALGNLCAALIALGRHQEAVAAADAMITLDPQAAAPHVSRGAAMQALGRQDEALASYEAALARDAGNHDAASNAGTILGAMGRHEDALAHYERALATRPDSPEALNNKGVSLAALGRNDEAAACYARAAAIKPDYPDVQKNRAGLLATLGRHEDALQAYDAAIALQPGMAELVNNRGTVLSALNRHAEALRAYERALELRPDFVDALNNRGISLAALQRFEESLACFQRAVALEPGHVNANWNEGLALLRLKRFTEGWKKHEWRWKKPEFAAHKYAFSRPLWLGGEDIAGKTILLVAEQGFGDTIQFSRYIPLLEARGARVLLFVPAPLVELLAFSFPRAEVISKTNAFPHFDYYCGLLSLPLAFGTQPDTIPAPPAYIKVPPAKAKAQAGRIGRSEALKVGLVWAGSATHKNDLNRSIAFATLAPLLAVPGVRFFSLQKDVRREDVAAAAAFAQLTLLGESLGDFADTAGAIAALDLVITVDTSVAHLSAAMGKPTWILVPSVSDWRWMPGESASSWYPDARLYWQPDINQWPQVIARVAGDLGSWRRAATRAAPSAQGAIGLEEATRQAAAFLRAGNLVDAEAVCRGVLQLQPDHANALSTLGSLRLQQQRPAEAVELFRRVVEQRPEDLHAVTNMAAALRSAERHGEALQFYDRAIVIAPGNVTPYVNRAVSLLALKRLDEALAAVDQALALDANNLAALNNRGVVLNEQGKHAEALREFDRALAVKPDYIDALNNRGLALTQLDRYDEAEQNYKHALAVEPGYANALNNLGHVYAALNRVHDAIRCFHEAQARKAVYVDANWNESLMQLVLGNYPEGWKLYEWRWQKPEFAPHKRNFHVPQWTGKEPIDGRCLFVHFEQGFGDTVQFIRYVDLLRERGAQVIVSVPESLRTLIAHSFPGIGVYSGKDVLPPFDFHIPLLSLPLALGTTLQTIPWRGAYLRPPADALDKWRARLGARDKARIGIAWSGNPKHANDRRRSIPAGALGRLLAFDARWYGLQREMREEDAALLKGTPLELLGPEFNDFSDTAAAMLQLDLVISVDTSVAHLAGALGVPTWLLLPFAPDWRWLLGRSDSPWYPGMRLFRQPRTGAIEELLADVRGALDVKPPGARR